VSEKVTLVIKPLEPLMLRSSGEFDIETKGPASYAKSLLIPRPSTIAGMLASLLYKGVVKENWIDEVKENMKPINEICGPLLVKENYAYVPLRIGGVFTLIKAPLDKLSESIRDKIYDIIKFYKDEDKEKIDYNKIDTEISELTREDLSSVVFIQPRLGIGLDRDKKVTKEGMLYIANYVSIDAEIHVILTGDKNEIKMALDGKIAFLGGEGRIVKLSILDKETFNCSKNTNNGILLSPLPVNEANRFIGELGIIGMGFDIRNKKRKEIVKAVLEGSIVMSANPITKYNVLGYGSQITLNLG
jgi:CRISPR-associated protein Cmr3